jgi:uncharacterized membrane protein
MDSVILNREQLTQLKSYIGKRSLRFTDPLVMQEILDHFACKVEELLNNEPGIRIEDAMIKAHRSFGVRGFAPIADHVEQSLVKRYQRLSYKEMKSVLLSAHAIGIAAIGLLVYLLAHSILGFFPKNISVILIDAPLIMYVVLAMAYRYRKLQQLREYKLLWAVAYQVSPVALVFNNVIGYFCFLLFFTPQNTGNTFIEYYMGIIAMFSAFSLIVQSRLTNRAKQEAEVTNQHQISAS